GRDAIVREVQASEVTILVGETGSGKTTQIPQYLLESGKFSGQIAITQPRRVAATSLATRVSAEQDCSLGSTVGYAVRFDERTTSKTRIKYLTDGMLVREMMGDPLLERYSVVVVDEAHERSLRTDLVLASLKKILKQRNGTVDTKGKSRAKTDPLKVVVMSATLDAEKFSTFFTGAKILYVKGRQHPVTIYHTSTGQTDYVDAALRTFFQIHVDQPPGDVLIFLPGQEDIESLEASITTYAKQLPPDAAEVLICPLYASLPNAQQTRVFTPAPANHRKCILATNIAETSITIPGVKYVIDTGKQKEKQHIAREYGSGKPNFMIFVSGFDALITTNVTRSSAMQRAGRAGREGKGYCFRLYTQEAFEDMEYSPQPEIQRTNLTSAILQLKCVGQDLENMEFMDRPHPESVGSALRALLLLGALDEKSQLTDFGRSMAFFPLEPQYAAVILASVDNNCTSEVLSIVSILSSSSPLFPDSSSQREAAADARAKFRHLSGDHLSMLNVWSAYEIIAAEGKGARKEWCKKNHVNDRALSEAKNIRDQLVQVCVRTGVDWKASCGQDDAPILKSLVRGLVQNVALLQPDGSYKQLMGPKTVKIHPGSFLADKKASAVLYDELTYTTNIYARGVSAIRMSWVKDIPVRKARHVAVQ
ncbi:P-loop containing nucleoside triphosphate hydrolase protein, partial [Stereum hirsutum FP-91666 SS1]|uniref:P-loop containing nucleoside triphosphate hydrolase protein n=1 Tax=Stereum hirsutum (strain FP-91666) TaxID=721885 RepID=UPI000444A775